MACGEPSAFYSRTEPWGFGRSHERLTPVYFGFILGPG